MNTLKLDEGVPFEAFVQAIVPDTGQTAELDRDAGTYALICFIPNAQGVPHFALGMVQQLTVE